MTIADIQGIAVIGAGTMGQGIAQVCARGGFNVILYDIQAGLLERARESIAQRLDALVSKGKFNADEKRAILSRITLINDFNALRADLIIEAAVERADVKRQIFSELESINSDRAILATNTSSLSVTEISSALHHRGRFAGLHFFNPAAVMKLVEVVRTASTSQETIDLLTGLAKHLGKVPVVAQDSPGFIVNRVARHFYVESLKVLEDGVADHQAIDELLRATGFKMGPFELMDLIGIDINFSVTSSLYEAFHGDPKFRPSRIQHQKVLAGHLGRKSGKGFYDYT